MNNLAKHAFALIAASTMLCGQAATGGASRTDRNQSAEAIAASFNFVSHLYIIKHRDPTEIAKVIAALGSGLPGALIQPGELNGTRTITTITVRDLPDNHEAIARAIDVLDVPAPEAEPINVRIDVLWASNVPTGKAVPPFLSDVVSELSKVLNYRHFEHAAVITQRILPSRQTISGSSILSPVDSKADSTHFSWGFQGSRWDSANHVWNAEFGASAGLAQIRNAHISLQPGQKAVVGTTTLSESVSMIVVVSMEMAS